MDRTATLKLTIKSLLEVVQTGAKNIEIAVMSPGAKLEMLPTEEIERYVEEINKEKAEEAEKKKPGRGAGGSAAESMAERSVPSVGEGVTEPSAGQS